MKNIDFIVIGILSYIGWFGAVFISKTEVSELSLLFPILMIAFLFYRRSLKSKEITWSLAISFIGILFDSLLNHFNFISFTEKTGFIVPLWMISIWLLFTFSMIKLGVKFSMPVWLSALLGLVMGPLSYKSGEHFDVLQFTSTSTYIVYGIFWALLFPYIIHLSKRSV